MHDPFASNGNKAMIGRSYISPNQVAMGGIVSDASPMSNYIPGGSFGGKSVGKGTVIPRHKPGKGGGSMGYNPHKPPHKHVIIDPHVPGRTVALDLGKVSPEAGREAYDEGMAFANEFMEDPPEMLDNIEMTIEEGPRLGAYAAARMLSEKYGAAPVDTFSALGNQAGGRIVQAAPGNQTFSSVEAQRPHVVPPATTGQHKAASFGTATVGRVNPQVNIVHSEQNGGIQVQRSASGGNEGPMARFRPQPAPVPVPVPAPVHVDSAPARVADTGKPKATAGPPTHNVIFDFGALGQITAQYHKVIHTSNGIILAWDNQWTYGKPYSPDGLTMSFALRVAGDPQDHLMVALPEFSFEFGGFQFYLLAIQESLPGLPAEQHEE